MDIKAYNHIRSGRAGFYEQRRGLIAVWGKEAVQFLDGMITNDMKTLRDGEQMHAAFPNAQGRLLAAVRVLRQGDRLLIEAEEATREKLYQNLFRFTFAGDFYVEDLSEQYSYFEIFGPIDDVFEPNVGAKFEGAIAFQAKHGAAYFVPDHLTAEFRSFLVDENGCVAIDEKLYETLRIESGIPKFGIDMDETTIVPELGIDEMISYTKGCYIGQEIIARIHFRGHVAKRLTGLICDADFDRDALDAGGTPAIQSKELLTAEGKSAGKITSATYSPKLEKYIALAFVRYDYLAEGTELTSDGQKATVTNLPFVS